MKRCCFCFSDDEVTNCRCSAQRCEQRGIQEAICKIRSSGIWANELDHVRLHPWSHGTHQRSEAVSNVLL